MMLSTTAALGAIGIFVAVYLAQRWTRKPGRRLPPGPPADPIIGHLRFLPNEKERAEKLHAWARQYGGIISLSVVGATVIVLNSAKAASELLERRNATYSDRPPLPSFERVGLGDILVFLPYGRKFIEQRKLVKQFLARRDLDAQQDMQSQEVNVMLKDICAEPQKYDKHIHRYTLGLILRATYGHRVDSIEDELFRLFEETSNLMVEASSTGPLEMVPILFKLPAWLPGAWWIRTVNRVRGVVTNMIDEPFEKTQEEMLSGKAHPSFISRHDASSATEEAHKLKAAAHQMVIGGSETTLQTIMIFLMCMMLNPDVQKRAQEEIDRVVGRDRLPDFADRASLPYVNCVLHETLRWHPVLPLGVAHKAMADDVYEGMYIPKGALVLANARSMTWDENSYHDPRSFKPERFLPKPLGAGEEFSPNLVFGWGRRICPGRFQADTTIWLAIARFLAVFTISKPRDPEGETIEPVITFVDDLLSHPLPFACNISPRDEQAARLVQDSYATTQCD